MPYIGKTPTAVPLTANDISDGIISNSKLAQDIISAETELATAPADTDEFLISDAGTLKRIDASLVGGGGITNVQSFQLNADVSKTGTGYVDSSWVANTSGLYSGIGSIVSQSSGTFSFSATGYYHVIWNWSGEFDGASQDFCTFEILGTVNNSAYNQIAQLTVMLDLAENTAQEYTLHTFCNISDTTNRKLRFAFGTNNATDGFNFDGHASIPQTTANFIRLGDAV